jgi:glycosyltransferase involved in cell wall biosynthesis
MRVIIGGESLLGPLTGIGQYTYQLAQHLQSADEIEDISFLAHGRMLDYSTVMRSVEDSQAGDKTGTSSTPSLFNRVRTVAAQSTALVKAYQAALPLLERWATRNYTAQDLLHSPNYLLPPFKGRRVVSILDLSTVRFPEFHPPARVAMVNHAIEQAVSKADHIITISDFIRQDLISRYRLCEHKVTTTYLAADEAFAPIDSATFCNNLAGSSLDLEFKGYFFFISTIEPRKNLERILDAHEAYSREAGEEALPLVIAGLPGWKSGDIHQRLQVLASTGKVRYLGFVQQRLVPTLMAGARGLVYPSIYEGLGLPVLEAMQSCTAVITSRDSAMSEIAGDAAMTVNPASVEEIADAMAEIARDDEKVTTLTERGLCKSQAFSWQLCAQSTLEAYRACLS